MPYLVSAYVEHRAVESELSLPPDKTRWPFAHCFVLFSIYGCPGVLTVVVVRPADIRFVGARHAQRFLLYNPAALPMMCFALFRVSWFPDRRARFTIIVGDQAFLADIFYKLAPDDPHAIATAVAVAG